MCFPAPKRKLGTQYTTVPCHFRESENAASFLTVVLSEILTGYPSYPKKWVILLKPSGFPDLVRFQGKGFKAILIAADMLLSKVYWNGTHTHTHTNKNKRLRGWHSGPGEEGRHDWLVYENCWILQVLEWSGCFQSIPVKTMEWCKTPVLITWCRTGLLRALASGSGGI